MVKHINLCQRLALHIQVVSDMMTADLAKLNFLSANKADRDRTGSSAWTKIRGRQPNGEDCRTPWESSPRMTSLWIKPYLADNFLHRLIAGDRKKIAGIGLPWFCKTRWAQIPLWLGTQNVGSVSKQVWIPDEKALYFFREALIPTAYYYLSSFATNTDWCSWW